MQFSQNEVCWRLPVLLNHHNQKLALIEKLRKQGLLISNHYFPASHIFGDDSPVNAKEVGLRAINLWVDKNVSPEDIRIISEEINRTVN